MNKIETKKLILIALNEINFDIVKKYIDLDKNKLKSFQEIFKLHNFNTTSEKEYQLLEPWIQWVSAHTGKTYEEHQVFRLGDISSNKSEQIFERIESLGYKVGNVCSMNVSNNLIEPAYFIPDPWTETKTDGSWWSRNISEALSQAINDNSKNKITIKSLIVILFGLIRFARFKNYHHYIKIFIKSVYRKWNRSIFLDMFINDLNLSLIKSKKPQFASVFFNAGAHIQHHYFYNSKVLKKDKSISNPTWYVKKEQDPLYDLLEYYDRILSDYLSLDKFELLIATGLSQKPYSYAKFYYRLKNHKIFLDKWLIKYESIQTLMTRDFIINFNNDSEALNAELQLNSLKTTDNDKLFDIDNRGKSLFLTLSYSNEVHSKLKYTDGSKVQYLDDEVVFVAIKNGMHHGEGYLFLTNGISKYSAPNMSHVKNIFNTINNYFMS